MDFKSNIMSSNKHTNELIHESSPYLLQHAHNPVNWVPWSTKAFENAKKENKLVLISIGYSSCHWCHVMERESFENESIATIMNEHFVCIKVDREERPDVDQIYMTAVQLMTNRGGWPLNCFSLPDGSPVYGGTYFPSDQWTHILESLADGYLNDTARFYDYAAQLKEGIHKSELISEPNKIEEFSNEKLNDIIRIWKQQLDHIEGGSNRAPKFPLPNNYLFLLRYAINQEDEALKKQVFLTLQKMAQGGIYDQIGGGFSRYSTDSFWKVPHFEKMLYDNAQLLSLYAQGFKVFKNNEFRQVIEQTIVWLEREMKSKFGSYYSALDADSEGKEGKYYIWDKEELKKILKDEFEWFSAYFNVNQKGYWSEEESYILLRSQSVEEFAHSNSLDIKEFSQKLEKAITNLLQVREQRIAPGLDDKSLTSWNALLISGLTDCYQAIGNEHYLKLSLEIADWIEKYQHNADGKLYHTFKNGKATIEGFLEDYAFVISAWLDLYSVTFDGNWLEKAEKMMEYAIIHFADETSKMFFFTDSSSELIARKMEITDNVISSSNSQMANNLFRLGTVLQREDYIERAKQMLSNVYGGMENYGSGYSNWSLLLMNFTQKFYETVIIGDGYKEKAIELTKSYLPQTILIASAQENSLELTKDRFKPKDTLIYICEDKTCQQPVNNIADALKILNKGN